MVTSLSKIPSLPVALLFFLASGYIVAHSTWSLAYFASPWHMLAFFFLNYIL